MSSESHFDFVVVGGGTAGAVVAARLSEDGGASVCLVESGPDDAGDERILNLPGWEAIVYSDLAYNYAIEPQERGNSAIVQLRSRVLGGCSAHNTCIAFEAPPSDLRLWSQLTGSDLWGAESVAPLYDRIRDRVVIAPCPPTNPLAQAFVAAAGEAGLPRRVFGRGELEEGAGWYNVNADGSRRESSSAAYLQRTPQPGRRLTLRTGTLATRIVVEDGAAVAVETSAGETLHAAREVIVCGGSFESPKLLMLSGIGDAEHLREHGIDVVRHLPGVGRNLVDHPEGIVLFEATRAVPDRVLTDWEAGLFARSAADVEVPDIMFHLASMAFDKNTRLRGYPTAEHIFSMHPNVARARSQGTVRLRDGDPASPPMVDPAYFTDPDGYDERIVVAGIKLARKVASQPALGEWIERELAPGPEVTGEAALSEYARLTANTVYHPSGTCKMGADDDELAVLDAQLRVRGVDRLRVADTSVYPTITTVNPAMTCLMVGEQCARLVLGAPDAGEPAVQERE